MPTPFSYTPLIAAFFSLYPLAAMAQEVDNVPSSVFQLGQIRVVAEKDLNPQTETTIRLDESSPHHLNQLGSTLGSMAGVTLSRNARNEQQVFVRGFDARQVPIYLDGIPLTAPYEGYVDVGRFSTYDLSEIRVAKGAASVLYGPNTLGGAINLISRKPTQEIEGDVQAGIGSGGLRRGAVNVGTNQGLWYAQLGVSAERVNSFALPKGFKDYKAKPTDTGNYRENADEKNRRIALKVGLTPNATDEYVLGYSRIDAEKGNPVYTGTSTDGIRYWRWPEWDKETVYLLTTTELNAQNRLKTRWYYDEHTSQTDAYKDARYQQAMLNKNFPAQVKDSSVGMSVEWVNVTLPNHELHAAFHMREDKHQEQAGQGAWQRYKDRSWTIALEDVWQFAPSWQLRSGLSHDRLNMRYAEGLNTSSTQATNAVVELSKQLDAYDALVYGAVSYKTRFPTLKDRYFTRMGSGLANPDLKPETARHVEVGLQAVPWQGGQLQTAVFYSRIHDLVQSVRTAAPTKQSCGGNKFCPQNQNVGKARHLGVELSLQQDISAQWRINTAYQYVAQRNLTDREIRPTHVPRHRWVTELIWQPHHDLTLSSSVEMESGRWVPVSGSGRDAFRSLHGFGNIGVNAAWEPHKQWRLDAGVNNVANKWYELADGYPMAGRTWYLNASYRF